MDVTVSREVLLNALTEAGSVFSKSNTLPVLNMVLIDADGESISATDLEVRADVHLEVPTQNLPGSELVNGQKLLKAVKSFAKSEEEVRLYHINEAGVERFRVECGRRSFTFPILNVPEWTKFPQKETSDWKIAFSVSSNEFKNALKRICIAASTDEARPILTGVKFDFSWGPNRLKLVSTDSYRLGVVELNVSDVDKSPNKSVIVPARTLSKLAKFLRKDEEIEFSVAEGAVQIKNGSSTWTIRTIEGEFPLYVPLFPQRFDGEMVFSSAELVSALKAALALKPYNDPVTFSFESGVDSAKLELQADGTVMEEEFEKTLFSGEKPTQRMGYNPKFLLDGLNFVSDSHASIQFQDSAKAVLITGKSGNVRAEYLLMPVRLPK